MQVLFLDFDGVLNSKQHVLAVKDVPVPGADTLSDADLFTMKRETNANNMWVLGYILKQLPDLKIVISSSWRNFFDLEQFKEIFKVYKLDETRIIDKTPKKMSSDRQHEIRMWLNEFEEINHKVPDWVALDDHIIFDIMNDEEKAREFLTDGWVGVSMHDAFKIIEHFKPDFKEPEILI